MTAHTNQVTVIMPVYNAALYVCEAIDSILTQTFSDFELLIIDDASTDETVSLIKKYNDSRIQLIEKPLNTGYTNSLNYGVKLAKGKYIARMDGDDISRPERFAKQLRFLEANPDIVLCGSWYQIIGSDRIVKLPENHDEIKVALLNGNCIAHPTVMFRKSYADKIENLYDGSKEPAEDYDLWSRMALNGRLHNLQEVLLDYRTHHNQVTKTQSKKQRSSVLKTQRNLYSELEVDLTMEENMVFLKILNKGLGLHFQDFFVLKKIQKKLLKCNGNGIFEPIAFKKNIVDFDVIFVINYFLKREQYTPLVYLQYLQIKKLLSYKLSAGAERKLAVKSVLYFKKVDKKV